MKDYLEKNRSLLKILTVISFLFLIISGEKISVFMFMYIVIMPFMVFTGSASFNLGLFSDEIWKVFFLIYILITYFSFWFLIRSEYIKIMPKLNKLLSLFSIGVLLVPAFFIVINPNNDALSWVLLSVFLSISLTTIFVIVKTDVSKP